MKIERLERERAKLALERLLFFDGQNVRMIPESLRQPRRRGGQVGPSGGWGRSDATAAWAFIRS
jgi:hypothetical protein